MSDHDVGMIQLGAVVLTALAWWVQQVGLPWFKEWIRKVVKEGNERDESERYSRGQD